MLSLDGTKKRGGWRGNPASLVALIPNQFPAQQYRICARCGRNAVKASRFCYKHSKRSQGHKPGRRESRLLDQMWRLGLIPLELMALKTWQDLSTVPIALRSPARLALVVLWGRRLREPLAWGQAWRKALELKAYQREGTQAWQAK